MTRFYPLYVRRSDGQLKVALKSKTEDNCPLPEQLDRTPDRNGVSDYYREIGVDEVKHLDWRRKLAGMLARELAKPEMQDRSYILESLPENYRLYEHVKSKATEIDGVPQKPNKTHAGGGHDRQDAYLYGHPLGRRKRYRSPADFFPHLLWLVSDETGDPDNCACKLCSPEELQGDEKAVASTRDSKQAGGSKKEEPQQKSLGKTSVVEMVVNKKGSSQGNQQVQPKPSPTPKMANIAAKPPSSPQVQVQVPTPLPQPRSADQQVDARYGSFIYRPGEVVWFNRGGPWGLGILVRRYYADNATKTGRNYVVQPLSNPSFHPAPVVLDNERLLRPWLAWTPPDYTHAYLRGRPHDTYDTVDWDAVASFGEGDMEVDGSLLAAKAIDCTYTPFDLLNSTTVDNGVEERRWNGMFLGGEKIWVGDPVRLRIGMGNEIMVVIEIVERTARDYGSRSARHTISLVGDIYAVTTVNSLPPANNALPARLREDLHRVNQTTMHAKRTAQMFKLMKRLQRINLTDVKGRWYEVTVLLPILLDDYESRKHELTDSGTWMNGRGDCNQLSNTKAPVRHDSRLDAFRRAVPSGMQLVDGTDPPENPQVQMGMPAQFGHAPHQDQVMQDIRHTGIEDLVNLDGMDHDVIPDFAQNFGAHGPWG
ncbi:hypothetical protein BDY21DRAFT_301291 [Lineolata rhizophorae]|uniref:Transcription-silencing protein Clr2-domain-containing protein n=1 Tax=Lineolata rhizophorae TaxID=578093 RepID=A0A6A6P613_9PEZI|nr:hypothetical protein BDY21DRAFT_301291 [Lineolata rhizophorae]